MAGPVISVRGLGKQYFLGEGQAHDTLRDTIAHGARSFMRLLSGGGANGANSEAGTFWALHDVSFDVEEGEVLGVIGRNGAGKSTLLKILSQITEPTRGEIQMRGRVASLLEVGTGFHPELSGRENIYLNGAILGMRKADIRKKFDEIVAFAEVEKFLDMPVKRYSSGMYMRLAFAVAAHLEPEILIVDEVLAVGDAKFQDKCMDRMREVSGRDRTVLFVSHNMVAIRNLCRNVIVLDQGLVIFAGPAEKGLNFYADRFPANITEEWVRPADEPVPVVGFERVRVHLSGKQPSITLNCEMALRCTQPSGDVFIAVDIMDEAQATIMQALPSARPFLPMTPGLHELTLEIDLPPLIPGRYSAGVWVGPYNTVTHHWIKRAVAFEIGESPNPDRVYPHTPDHGRIVPQSRVRVAQAAR